jgi:signal transduction histidine kinase
LRAADPSLTDTTKALMSMTRQSSARDAPAREGITREPLLELYDALAQYQLRDAGAEVAAAIAHAVGTPLNVISGRAELIRHDPSNALAQVVRIEEQVKKLATGLRQLVDYLAIPDPRTPQRPASVSRRTPADGTPPEARGAAPARASSAPLVAFGSETARVSSGAEAARAAAGAEAARASNESLESPGEITIVDARAVLSDVLALAAVLSSALGVEVVGDDDGLEGARVERLHALATLSSLVSCAVRHLASRAKKGANGHAGTGNSGAMRVRVGGGVASQGVVFELIVPGLSVVEGWQLEHFQARPAATDCSDFYRTMSICAAVVRGHGGKLLIESVPNVEAIVIRFSCRNEAAS